MNKRSLRSLALSALISLTIACATYIVDLWLLASNVRISPHDASFIEGILSIALGFLLFLGSGGITQTTRKAAALAASADAISSETIGPSEVYKRDAWKPEGFARVGLVLITAGLFLVLIYFLAP